MIEAGRRAAGNYTKQRSRLATHSAVMGSRWVSSTAASDPRFWLEDIDGEALKSDHFGEAVNSPRDVVEGVAELDPCRHVRLAKPGQIGRDHMKSVGEPR